MRWLPVVVAAVLSGAVLLVAAMHGHAVELLWLPSVVIAAAWPKTSRLWCAGTPRGLSS